MSTHSLYLSQRIDTESFATVGESLICTGMNYVEFSAVSKNMQWETWSLDNKLGIKLTRMQIWNIL